MPLSPNSPSGASDEDPKDSRDSQATPRGPSWGLMLSLIAVAILVAFAIAWAFITPLLHRHF